jgi:hypothetical protein
MTQTTNQKRLLDLALSATTEQHYAGLIWYSKAYKLAVTLAECYDTTITVSAGVLAALSPQLSWESNKESAKTALYNWQHGLPLTTTELRQTSANVDKARAILLGESPAKVLGKCLPSSGHKVFNFYHCIRYPNRWDGVCLDRHAIAAWQTPCSKFKHITPNRYARVEQDYQTVAREMGIAPMQAQAIVWCVVRGGSE